MRIVDERHKTMLGTQYDFGIDVYPFDDPPAHEVKFTVGSAGSPHANISLNAGMKDMTVDEAVRLRDSLNQSIQIALTGDL